MCLTKQSGPCLRQRPLGLFFGHESERLLGEVDFGLLALKGDFLGIGAGDLVLVAVFGVFLVFLFPLENHLLDLAEASVFSLLVANRRLQLSLKALRAFLFQRRLLLESL